MRAAAILVSDRPNRSAAIAEPLGRVVPFDVVGPDERWSQRAGVRVVVVDLDLGRLESTTCLNRLQNRLGAPGLNVIVLLGPNDQGRTVQARTLGATLCLPRANATDVMLPFLRKHFGVEVAASPTAPATAPPSEAQRRTEAGVRQAESALACLIGARGRSGTLDLGPADASRDRRSANARRVRAKLSRAHGARGCTRRARIRTCAGAGLPAPASGRTDIGSPPQTPSEKARRSGGVLQRDALQKALLSPT